MKYNKPYAAARWGTMAKDWEAGVDFPRMIKERLDKAQAAVKAKGLGAVLCFNFDNIRYITGIHIGEWCRDKMNRYCICPKEGAAPICLILPCRPRGFQAPGWRTGWKCRSVIWLGPCHLR